MRLTRIRKVTRIRKAPPVDLTAHTRGTKQGNAKGNYERQAGHLPDGRSTAERSTSINAKAREPIDPRMPNLSPG
jgi:hypothetical protein